MSFAEMGKNGGEIDLKWKVRPQINIPVRHPRGVVKSSLIQEMTPEVVAADYRPSALEGPGLLSDLMDYSLPCQLHCSHTGCIFQTSCPVSQLQAVFCSLSLVELFSHAVHGHPPDFTLTLAVPVLSFFVCAIWWHLYCLCVTAVYKAERTMIQSEVGEGQMKVSSSRSVLWHLASVLRGVTDEGFQGGGNVTIVAQSRDKRGVKSGYELIKQESLALE